VVDASLRPSADGYDFPHITADSCMNHIIVVVSGLVEFAHANVIAAECLNRLTSSTDDAGGRLDDLNWVSMNQG
jgi:hypothetical protein